MTAPGTRTSAALMGATNEVRQTADSAPPAHGRDTAVDDAVTHGVPYVEEVRSCVCVHSAPGAHHLHDDFRTTVRLCVDDRFRVP